MHGSFGLSRILRLLLAAALTVGAITFAAAPAQADQFVGSCLVVSNPTPDNYTNCSGQDLAGANFGGLNLSYANFSGANLSGASFVGATLPFINFTGVDLTFVDLTSSSDGITLGSPPAITADSTALTAVRGAQFTFTPTVTGDPAPTVDMYSGALPAGLTLDPSGVISGIATTSGVSSFVIRASNTLGTSDLSVTVTVATLPTVGGFTYVNTLSGNPEEDEFQIPGINGYPAPVITSSALPPGYRLTASGLLTPSGGCSGVGSAGRFTVTVTASNAAGSASSNGVIEQWCPPGLASGTATFTEGLNSSFTPQIFGYPFPTVTTDDPLPAGLNLDSSTGVISGTPTAGTHGVYDVDLLLDNPLPIDATNRITITVNQRPAITGPSSTFIIEGQDGSYQPTVTGDPAPTVSVVGDLPFGVLLDRATGELSGTTLPGTAGIYPLTLVAGNGVGDDATLDVDLTVAQLPAIAGTLPEGDLVVGDTLDFNPTLTGFPAPTVDLAGALPAGLFFNSSTGSITGTVGANAVGTFPLTLTASNVAGSAELKLTLEIVAGDVATMTLIPSDSKPDEGDTVTIGVEGFDEHGNSTGDESDEVVVSSSVASDDIDGTQVTFNHASPHTLTVVHTATGVTASITVEVIPSARAALTSLLPDTGGPTMSLLKLGLSLILIGCFLLAPPGFRQRSIV